MEHDFLGFGTDHGSVHFSIVSGAPLTSRTMWADNIWTSGTTGRLAAWREACNTPAFSHAPALPSHHLDRSSFLSLFFIFIFSLLLLSCGTVSEETWRKTHWLAAGGRRLAFVAARNCWPAAKLWLCQHHLFCLCCLSRTFYYTTPHAHRAWARAHAHHTVPAFWATGREYVENRAATHRRFACTIQRYGDTCYKPRNTGGRT